MLGQPIDESCTNPCSFHANAIGADAVARDANGNFVSARNIHDSASCINLPREAENLDVIQVSNGYRLNIHSGLNCQGQVRRTKIKGDDQFPGFRWRSWQIGL